MRITRLALAFVAFTFIPRIKAGAGWGDTVDEGTVSVYSEASDWSYDDSDDGNSGSSYYGTYYSSSSSSSYRSGSSSGSSQSQRPSGPAKPFDEQVKELAFAALIFSVVSGIFICCDKMCSAAHKKREEYKRKKRQEKIERLVSSVQEIDSNERLEPGQEYQRPIFYTGDMKTQPVIDQIFNACTDKHLVLNRQVEVYCWTEQKSHRVERRGKQTRTVTDYRYTSRWVDSRNYVASTNFKDQRHNTNRAPTLHSKTFSCGVVKVGPVFTISAQDLASQTPIIPLQGLKEENLTLPQQDPFGAWTFEAFGPSCLLRRRLVADKDTIGDLRVTFTVPKALSDEDCRASVLGKVVEQDRIVALPELQSCVSVRRYNARDMIEQLLK